MKIAPRSPKAFSLIEIIAVIAIVAILVAIAIPALRNNGGVDPGAAARTLSGVIQVAASEAKAKSMPVWMGFYEEINGQDRKLVVAAVTTADGSGDLSGGVIPVGKPETISGIRLSDSLPAYGGRPSGVTQLATADSDVEFQSQAGGIKFACLALPNAFEEKCFGKRN